MVTRQPKNDKYHIKARYMPDTIIKSRFNKFFTAHFPLRVLSTLM